MLFTACGSSEKIGCNPARMLRSHEQAELLNKIAVIDSAYQLYEWDYTADYNLDRLIEADVRTLSQFIFYLGKHDLRLMPGLAHLRSVMPGCSCFATKDDEGHAIAGRNFDYISPSGVSDAIIVRTAPKEGYRSMGLVSLSLLQHPPHSLCDGTTDLSLLAAAPYLVMDGINEKGFFVSVLYLDGKPTEQHDKSKHNIMTLIALRLMLDRAASVEEAIALMEQYNMYAGIGSGSYHFFVADSTGRSAVIEYVPRTTGNKVTWEMAPLNTSYVTNFYLNERYREIGHGQDRYKVLKACFEERGGVMNGMEAMELLQAVSQEPTERKTSNTQWSAVYDLQKKCLRVCVGRHYDRVFDLSNE